MSKKASLWLCTAALLLFASGAHADVFCSVSAPGFTTTYNSTLLNTIPFTVTVTCTKGADNNKSNVSFQLAAIELPPIGQALSGANALNYTLATDPACSTLWDAANLLPTPIVTHSLSPNSSISQSYNVYGCIPAGQVPPLGTYSDTVTMNFLNSKVTGDTSSFAPGAFSLAITMPTTCVVSTPPAGLNFAYTAFSASNVLANSSFGMTCTAGLPYTMALDATVGVVAGLNYTLGLSNTTPGGTGSVSSTGTASPQSFYVNGAMAAGQAGSCPTASCTASQIHTLTITY